MAIRPKFAHLIYTRKKHFEFRRVRSKFVTGDLVFIYETAPVSRVTGEFRVGKTVYASPEKLVKLEQAPQMREVAQHYLRGAAVGTAIEIETPQRWKTNCDLEQVLPGCRPPRSYLIVKEPTDGLLRCAARP